MSEENVEVVRRGYEAFDRGDLDGMVADFAPWATSTTTVELGLQRCARTKRMGSLAKSES
jgi:ketosteroid isomerase-like protein